MKTNRAAARQLSWMLTLVLLAAQAYPQSAGPEFPNPGKVGMSRDEQRQLGLQAAAQVYKQMPVLPDNSPETQYIRQLGEKLVATIPPEYSWPFEFHVVAQKEINAFALPGGPMFINLGTITAAANEAQLAGVMAHEMSHVYMQHSAKQASKAEATGFFAGLVGAVVGATVGGSLIGQLGQMGIQLGAQGLMLKYSRTDEAQADAVGAIIMYKAGYDPQAMADFFKTLESQNTGAPPQWLSDHPDPGNRQAAIEKEIRNWPPKNYQTTSAAFQKTKQHALTVKAYTGEEIAAGAKTGQWAALNQKNGAVFHGANAVPVSTSTSAPGPSASTTATTVSLQSVLPSQHMVAQDLGVLKLSRPENWPITMPKHRADYVTIAPEAGVTANGVGYGMMINAAGLPEGERMNLDQATSALLQQLQRSNGVKPGGSAQPITVSGVQGRSVMMQSTSPFLGANGRQQAEADWLVTVPRSSDTLFYFVFIAPQSQFERFRPTFESVLKSVQF